MMSTETKQTDINPSSVECTVLHASSTSHKLNDTASTSESPRRLLTRGKPRSKAITCTASEQIADASNFPLLDSYLTTSTFETAQNAPESEVEQNTKGRLEYAEAIIEHVPSTPMILDRDLSVSQVVYGDAYTTHSPQEVTTLTSKSTATIREPTSCPPQEEMMQHEEQGPPSRETRHEAMDADSLHSPLLKEDMEWDVARDNETLRSFSYNRLNLVLDSMFPHIAPHIVITPAEETWEDQYIPWQNRVNPQWPCYLCVPPLDFSTGRMLDVEPQPCQPLLETQTCPLPNDSNQATPISSQLPMSVSSPSILNHPPSSLSQDEIEPSFSPAYLEQLSVVSHGYKLLTDEMITVQKALCKATFFAVSDIARVLRERYDSEPNVLSTLEPPFTWTDPGEPILIANRRIHGAIILDSFCPFLAPHIIINSPPPQHYQLTENNTTPYTQDAAFGDRLVVEAHYTEIINEGEDSLHYSSSASRTDIVDNWEDQSSEDFRFVDLLENDMESRPGSPLPETPIDGDDDRYYYFGDTLEEDHLEIQPVYQSIYGVNSTMEAELFSEKLQPTSRSMFYIEEDDDELPSLDDW